MAMDGSTINSGSGDPDVTSTMADHVAKTVKVTCNGQGTFSDVVLDDNSSVSSGSKKGRVPKRILHFSDGILEEYSTDDEQEEEKKNNETALLDTKSMAWIPYLWYLAWWFGCKTLEVCDYMGENLASFFGITTPKYQFEIEQYQRMVEEEEAEKKREDEENAGWREKEPEGVKIDLPEQEKLSVKTLETELPEVIASSLTKTSEIFIEKERY